VIKHRFFICSGPRTASGPAVRVKACEESGECRTSRWKVYSEQQRNLGEKFTSAGFDENNWRWLLKTCCRLL
jgi:hypothetical protein